MIKIVKGDMIAHLKSDEAFDAYAQQCNCFCRMGRGLAPLLAKAVDGLREVDNATIEGDRSKLGTFTCKAHGNGTVIYNIYGQYHWSLYKVAPNRNTDYDALRKGLFAVMGSLHSDQYRLSSEGINRQMTLGLPLIGCGLAGGDWEGVVYPMICEVFGNSGVDVTIFKL